MTKKINLKQNDLIVELHLKIVHEPTGIFGSDIMSRGKKPLYKELEPFKGFPKRHSESIQSAFEDLLKTISDQKYDVEIITDDFDMEWKMVYRNDLGILLDCEREIDK